MVVSIVVVVSVVLGMPPEVMQLSREIIVLLKLVYSCTVGVLRREEAPVQDNW